MLVPKSVSDLLSAVENEQILQSMISQLNKDFSLANIDFHFDLDLSAAALRNDLSRTLERLLEHRYDDYLSLMYRIDVSEKELLNLPHGNLHAVADQLTFVVLKRIYKKVWFRNRL